MKQKTIRVAGVGDAWWKPGGCVASLEEAAARRGASGEGPILSFVDLAERTGTPTGVALLKDAKVVGDARLVALADDTVIGDLQFLFGAAHPEQHWLLRQRRLRVPTHVPGEAALVAASNGDNYYHWLFDALPRIGLLEMAGCKLHALPRVVLNHKVHAFQAQSLERLGLRAEQFHRSAKRELARYDRLWVPSMPGPLGQPPAWVCEFLRRRLAADAGDAPRRRLYVSRRHAAGRRVLNEDDILPLLARHAIEVVHAEKLAFAEQVALFACAAVVIAVHGAGMSNTVFCPTGSRVIELRSPTHFNECFSTIAANSGLVYRSMVLSPANSGPAPHEDRYGNLVVDPAALAAELERLD